MTRDAFQQDLESLDTQLLEMGEAVQESLNRAMESMKCQDCGMAEQIIEDDQTINEMEARIDDFCLTLIARQQPMARDLRKIGTVMKIVTDLERMADHASDMAKVTLRIGQEPLIKPLIDLPRMVELAGGMVRDALAGFVAGDAQAAPVLARRDHEVDHLNNQIFRELLVYMMEDPENIRQATALLLAAQHVERIADHATNIAEWTIFLETGERLDLNP